MNFILDNPESEKQFQDLLVLIQSRKNGEVSSLMEKSEIHYKMNWGVSLIELRQIALKYDKSHLLSLKLWNKQWRETMILATMIDDPILVSEEQMDFWTKSFENTEIAEQASANLWVHSKFAFIKSLEWCRGKKHFVRYSGIHLAGRLAITAKNDPDEFFDSYFEEFYILAKDPKLFTVIYRTVIALGQRSGYMNNQSIEFARQLNTSDSENARKLGIELYDELSKFNTKGKWKI